MDFKINLPFPDLMNEMAGAQIGIHTMNQEHFGIGIVEMMAAGLLTIAHRSGGPLTDIIGTEDKNLGMLASNPKEYGDAIAFGIKNFKSRQVGVIREQGRESTKRFSNDVFQERFLDLIDGFLLK